MQCAQRKENGPLLDKKVNLQIGRESGCRNIKEIPAGSLPRSLDVILRHDIVEQARAVTQVVKGLRALCVRDLSYRLAFIANSVQICDGRRDADIRNRKRDAEMKTIYNSRRRRYTTTLVSRSVYTSGKSSSAAGLTATVAKEPETGEFCMRIQSNIERKNKSILAAAIPQEAAMINLNLEAILSRFDLVYVMIDDPDDTTDFHIASHIVRVHQKRENAVALPSPTAQLKRYIQVAKSKKPKLSVEARKVLVDSYVALRRGDTAPGSRVAYRMTKMDKGRKQEGKKLVITDEYFQRVTQALVMRLRQHEETVMQDGVG
ncbi:unnamed protein product [Lactuca virosa]|uniref:DNA helicase n=1 Tax=Lactuca virosa TaxID=75947 RepID=A0AAU9P738_9ASTR|nr:unnamed protein product [Lactuca virosa]